MDGSEAVARLGSARVARLATVRPNGIPHVVPLVFAFVDQGKGLVAYWVVDEKPKSRRVLQRIKNLEANPIAELLVDGYEEEWSRWWWVRASGRAREVLAPEERQRALEALVDKYPQYRTARPDGRIFALEVEGIDAWSALG